MAKKSGKVRRVMRHQRVRKKVIGTPERPRLAVYRSLNNIKKRASLKLFLIGVVINFTEGLRPWQKLLVNLV